ncbi:MAG: iron-containing alcohol dehydrogenase [Muribaculaceae bacterium]|nr:iron-containing alcohol dehydrogenase [Muribaculaceae bacterium]
MQDFNFWAPTRYIFGHDAELKTGIMAAQSGWNNILLVYGGQSAVKSGLLDRVRKAINEAGVSVTLFGGIRPNPVDGPVREAIAICREKNIDGIIAVGGGSVIDTAKAIAAGALYFEGDFWDFFTGKRVVEAALPIGVVLTIPAAGSEGSGNAVITDSRNSQKISIRTEYQLRPKWALMNPALTLSLPWHQTVAGIADMMAHIMERYLTTTPDVEVTDRISEGLLMAIMKSALKLKENPDDYEARANIMWSGTLAHNGTCGCGRNEDWTSHALEHVLSAIYDVTHGAGLAVVFPAWIQFLADKAPEKPAMLGRRIFNIPEQTPDREAALLTADALRGFFSQLDLPVTFAGLGIENPDIPLYVEYFHRDKGTPYVGYYPLYPEETAQVYALMK